VKISKISEKIRQTFTSLFTHDGDQKGGVSEAEVVQKQQFNEI